MVLVPVSRRRFVPITIAPGRPPHPMTPLASTLGSGTQVSGTLVSGTLVCGTLVRGTLVRGGGGIRKERKSSVSG